MIPLYCGGIATPYLVRVCSGDSQVTTSTFRVRSSISVQLKSNTMIQFQWWKSKLGESGGLCLRGPHTALFSRFTLLPPPTMFPTPFPAGNALLRRLLSFRACLCKTYPKPKHWVMPTKCRYCDYKICSFNRPLFHFGRRYARSLSLPLHAPFRFLFWLFRVSYSCVACVAGFWKCGFRLGLGLPSLLYSESLWWEFWCFWIEPLALLIFLFRINFNL